MGKINPESRIVGSIKPNNESIKAVCCVSDTVDISTPRPSDVKINIMHSAKSNTVLPFIGTEKINQAAVALGQLSVFKKNQATNGVVGVLGVMILGLGIVAFTGYFTGMETAYGWGHLTKMAIHTALGFIILGIGFFALAWYQENKLYPGKPKWLYLPIGIASLTITLAFWQALVAQAQSQIDFTGYNSLVDESVLFFWYDAFLDFSLCKPLNSSEG